MSLAVYAAISGWWNKTSQLLRQEKSLRVSQPIRAEIVKSVIGIAVQMQGRKTEKTVPPSVALYLNRSAVPAHDLRAHPKSQARSGFALGAHNALGAHKSIKEPRPDLGLNPRSGVRDTRTPWRAPFPSSRVLLTRIFTVPSREWLPWHFLWVLQIFHSRGGAMAIVFSSYRLCVRAVRRSSLRIEVSGKP